MLLGGRCLRRSCILAGDAANLHVSRDHSLCCRITTLLTREWGGKRGFYAKKPDSAHSSFWHVHCQSIICFYDFPGEGISLIRQTTLARAVSTSGHGLHTGEPSRITLHPAPAYSGYIFRRTDLNDFEIQAAPQFVARVSYATTLMRQGVMIATVEHLLAALAGSHIDNCLIEIDSLEVPILDGSAEPFIEMIEHAGITKLEAPRQFFRVLKRVEVVEGSRRMSISPASQFSISCLIEFSHPMVGTQRREIEIVDGQFSREVASAR